jgi:hypothetical protein
VQILVAASQLRLLLIRSIIVMRERCSIGSPKDAGIARTDHGRAPATDHSDATSYIAIIEIIGPVTLFLLF